MTAGGEVTGTVIVAGYTVIPIRFDDHTTVCHDMYIKENQVRATSKEKPAGKTLFVVNVPPYCTKEALARIFTEAGDVKNVYVQDKPSNDPVQDSESEYFPNSKRADGFKCAYVVFAKASSMSKALNMPYGNGRVLSTEEKPIVTGINKWYAEHVEKMNTDVNALKREIDQFMEIHDQKLEAEKQRAKETEGVPDKDGWVTVTRHGKNKGVPRTEIHEKRSLAREKKKRKEKELLNFYSFQARDSKKEHIAELRKRFEEDKNKIALMRASRKFKPY
ncbi:ribosomal RNA-processing protein 7 homolog A-like [Tubulanus polymorphus]|uniref:ribosomal RNA-processing protein 7 homolog A-like n=1 Tax=Tubulanus polymorphus TaxID=672921 RepID=UPI003DA45EF4